MIQKTQVFKLIGKKSLILGNNQLCLGYLEKSNFEGRSALLVIENYSLFTTVYQRDFLDQHFVNKIFYSRCP